jgi:hypothetical protein
MLFETLDFVPYSFFSMEVTSSVMSNRLTGDTDYFRTFVQSCWKIMGITKELSAREIKQVVY